MTAKTKPPPAEEAIVEIKEDEIVEITDDIDEAEPLEVIDDEAPVRTGRRRGTKGSLFQRFPMWVWLTGGGVAAVVLLGGCAGVLFVAWSMFGGNITKANYDKIKLGSSEKDVTGIWVHRTPRGRPCDSPLHLLHRGRGEEPGLEGRQ